MAYDISRPIAALVVQGSKRVTTGSDTFDFGAGESMLIAADLPTISQITRADILSRSDRRKLTPRTTTDIPKILDHVKRAREKGYATSLKQVYVGELAVAAALKDKDGRPFGAIHVAGSLGEWQLDHFERQVSPLVVAAATAISF